MLLLYYPDEQRGLEITIHHAQPATADSAFGQSQLRGFHIESEEEEEEEVGEEGGSLIGKGFFFYRIRKIADYKIPHSVTCTHARATSRLLLAGSAAHALFQGAPLPAPPHPP